MQITRGDIWYYTPWEAEGAEQKGKRPGIVVSNDKANRFSPNVTLVPLTASRTKATLPTHVMIGATNRLSIALCESVTTLSKARLTTPLARASEAEMEEISRALRVHLDL